MASTKLFHLIQSAVTMVTKLQEKLFVQFVIYWNNNSEKYRIWNVRKRYLIIKYNEFILKFPATYGQFNDRKRGDDREAGVSVAA